jgi:hypothetical protein
MLTMLTGILVILTIGLGWRKIAIELRVDKNFLRCILAVVVPLQIWMGWVGELQKLLFPPLTMTVLFPNSNP